LTTIICVGNELRGDDAAGLAVAERLRARGLAAVVEQPPNLIDVWAGMDDVVVVDTVRSGTTPPGTVHRIDAARGPLPAEMRSGSTHLLGLAEAIELARVIGALPARLRVFGIEGSAFGCGEPLSDQVERAVGQVADELTALRDPAR
jgi:hydrogenase maturation protease